MEIKPDLKDAIAQKCQIPKFKGQNKSEVQKMKFLILNFGIDLTFGF
jgi:hypothetical protein